MCERSFLGVHIYRCMSVYVSERTCTSEDRCDYTYIHTYGTLITKITISASQIRNIKFVALNESLDSDIIDYVEKQRRSCSNCWNAKADLGLR